MAVKNVTIGRSNVLEGGSSQVIDDASNYVEAFKIKAESRPVILHVMVGAGGALGALKVTQTLVSGGTHKDLFVGADFGTPNVALPWVLGTNIHLTAANGTFQLRLESGAWEYTIWAKKATSNTTMILEGRAL